MGHYETAFWTSDADAPTMHDRMSGQYHPYVPDKLAGTDIRLSVEAAAACEAAVQSMTQLDASAKYISTAESLSRMLLRSEAISSSRIEGLEMSVRRMLEDEALSELGVSRRPSSIEVEVMGNVRAMQEAIEGVSQKDRLSVADIQDVHAALMRGTKLEAYGGSLRDSQNWIGGSWYHPLAASYVPPRPELVMPLMEDLLDFIEHSHLPAMATAAIAHAQFETIHPFADGNGRTGRALVHIVLKRRGLCPHTVAPISLVLGTLRDEYVRRLSAFRYDDQEDGVAAETSFSQWVVFFCHAAIVACDRSMAFEERISMLRHKWDDRVRPRHNSAAELLLDALPGNPVVSIASVARITGRSYPAARGAVRELEANGVLVQSSKNRKSGLYVAQEVIDEFSLFERALATSSGNTRLERPARPVPQRPKS